MKKYRGDLVRVVATLKEALQNAARTTLALCAEIDHTTP